MTIQCPGQEGGHIRDIGVGTSVVIENDVSLEAKYKPSGPKNCEDEANNPYKRRNPDCHPTRKGSSVCLNRVRSDEGGNQRRG